MGSLVAILPGLRRLLPAAVLLAAVPALAGERTVIEFAGADASAWFPVHDGVMGGLSSGSLTITGQGTGRFAGEVSLANNGGFASVRTILPEHDLGSARGLVLRIRGDGRPYRLRLRTDLGLDGVAYQVEFATAADRWQEVFCPFTEFRPVFRGRPVRGAPDLDPAAVRQLGLMIADKTAGPFALELAWIRARD